MPEYDRTNTGALFANDKTSDKQPDRTGTLNVDGVEYRLAGWLKKDRNGKQYLSLKVQPAEQQQSQGQRQPRNQPREDEIPF